MIILFTVQISISVFCFERVVHELLLLCPTQPLGPDESLLKGTLAIDFCNGTTDGFMNPSEQRYLWPTPPLGPEESLLIFNVLPALLVFIFTGPKELMYL